MLRPVTRVIAVLAALAALVPASAAASWGHPDSAISGGMLVQWTADSGDATDPASVVSHREGTVRYTILGRARGAGVPQAWVPGEFPSWTDPRVGNGFFLRARVAVEHFAASERTPCENGQYATVTSRVTATPQEHALLSTEEPTIDLVHHRGTIDLDLPFVVHRDGIVNLGQVVVGTGMVTVTTTGTMCATDENGAPTVIAQDPSTVTEPIAALMSEDVVAAVDDEYSAMRTTVHPGGGFDLAPAPRKLLPDTSREPLQRIAGSFTPVLRDGGPGPASSALCTLPSFRDVERLRTLAAVQRLLRREGFTRAVVGPTQPAVRQDGHARFRLKFGAPAWPCGEVLGDRRDPALFPLRR